MFCMKCGKKIDDDSKFCPFCGNVVVNSATNAGIQPNTSPLMQTAKFFNKKIMIGAVSCIVAVVAVIGVVKLLSGGFGKTIAEQLFLMSWTDLIDLDEKEFKSSLRDEGITYEQGEGIYDMDLRTKSVSPFMGYDSYFGYYSVEIYDGLSFPMSTMFAVTFETKDDYEDGKDDILRYLDKNLVKGYDAIVSGTENPIIGGDNPFVDFATQTNNYLLDISTIDFNMFIESLIESMIEQADLTEEEIRQIREYLEDEEVIKEMQEMQETAKVYKFSTIAFVENQYALTDLLEYYFDEDDYPMVPEDFPKYGYCIMNSYIPMTDEEFQSLMSYFNYDTIDQKEIDLDEVRKTLDVDLLDSGIQDSEDDLRSIYFVENHGIDIRSDMDVGTDELKRIWYIKTFGWDNKAADFVDLSAYKDSSRIYCAVTFNYSIDDGIYFESDLDKAVYLSEKNYNPDTGESFTSEDEKRVYFLEDYSYDTASKKAVDREIVDTLVAYANYSEEVLAEEGIYGYNLIYIDDNDVPECLVWTEYDNRVYVLSYKNGNIESVTTQERSSSTHVSYTPKLGTFVISVYYGVAGAETDIFTLVDSFDWILYADTNRTFSWDENDRVYTIDGQSVDAEVYNEKTQIELEYTINGGTAYSGETYSSLLAAYDALRTKSYYANLPEIAEFELSDGVLTVSKDGGSRFGWNSGEQEGFSFSYPVADNCSWESGYYAPEFVTTEYMDYSTMKECIDSEQARYKENKEKYGDDFSVESPPGFDFIVMDEVVVKVYMLLP